MPSWAAQAKLAEWRRPGPPGDVLPSTISTPRRSRSADPANVIGRPDQFDLALQIDKGVNDGVIEDS